MIRVPVVINDGNGRSGRDAGNNGFRTDGRREDGRVGEVGEVRSDETSGRVELSEMAIRRKAFDVWWDESTYYGDGKPRIRASLGHVRE